ncbi:hypothetical protein BKA67DRAFT_43400 [Truncatella angustata]|uniref:Uncharacterized protein n=1 Tax=Truncatella angustata TaxID=152316 RepID=A0A9P8UXH4_9PEZI|nr:uncharacterized protein BKA67DRAFT_43400 [Truncatella angustata]KAH6660193.1 hypothetical protein BKA67DRAFT_43400 [Truncatella angustata]
MAAQGFLLRLTTRISVHRSAASSVASDILPIHLCNGRSVPNQHQASTQCHNLSTIPSAHPANAHVSYLPRIPVLQEEVSMGTPLFSLLSPPSQDNTLNPRVMLTRALSQPPAILDVHDHANLILVVPTTAACACWARRPGVEPGAGLTRDAISKGVAIPEAPAWIAWLRDLEPVVAAILRAEMVRVAHFRPPIRLLRNYG